jgi:hypothetical protein
MDGDDFEFIIKNQSSTGLQAILVYDGEEDPFAFFFGHRLTEEGYSGSLVFLDPAESLKEIPWEPTLLNIADILDTNMGIQLLDAEVMSRFDPAQIEQPSMRHNRISRASVDYESYELQIEAIATADFERAEQAGEKPDDEAYWPVAKVECIMDSTPPVAAIFMQDASLCTDEHTQDFVNWLGHAVKWPEGIRVSICMPAQSLGSVEIASKEEGSKEQESE